MTAAELIEAVQAAAASADSSCPPDAADLDKLNTLLDLDNLDFEPSPIFANAMNEATTTTNSTSGGSCNAQLSDQRQQQQQQHELLPQFHRLHSQHIPAILDNQQQQLVGHDLNPGSYLFQEQQQHGSLYQQQFVPNLTLDNGIEPEISGFSEQLQQQQPIKDQDGGVAAGAIKSVEQQQQQQQPDLPLLRQFVGQPSGNINPTPTGGQIKVKLYFFHDF